MIGKQRRVDKHNGCEIKLSLVFQEKQNRKDGYLESVNIGKIKSETLKWETRLNLNGKQNC